MKTKYIIIIIGFVFLLVIGGLMIYNKNGKSSVSLLEQEKTKSFSLQAGEGFVGTKTINGTSIIVRTGNTETIGDLKTNKYTTTFYSINKFRDNGTGDYVPSEDTINLSISKTGELQIKDLVLNKSCYFIMNYSKVNPASTTNPDITIRKESGYWYFITDTKEDVNSMDYKLNCRDFSNIKYDNYELRIDDISIDFKQASIEQNISTTYDAKTSILSFAIEDGKTGNLSKVDPIVTYTSSPAGNNWTVPAGVNSVQVLVVAGGGGGGGAYGAVTVPRRAGGGGGAGGLIYNASYPVTPLTNVTNVVVGTGGAGGTYNNGIRAGGYNGTNSSFGTLNAMGGGGGGGAPSSCVDGDTQGAMGGSGGGEGVCQLTSDTTTGGAGYSGQGYLGGLNYPSSTDSQRGAGGGGGATAMGGNATISVGGAGGAGYTSSISGSSVTYATGGAGGHVGTGANGADGTDAEGDGGGGAISSTVLSYAGGDGGDGIVIINYTVDTIPPNVTINSPTNTTYSSASILFNVTALDTFGVSSCWYSINNWATNYTMSNVSNSWNATNSSVPNGSYRALFGCNDTLNNLNMTSYVDFTVSVAVANCWTKTGNILYIPTGCVYNISKGAVG